MDFMFWWTGLFAHVIFWGAMVIAIFDKVWAAFSVTLMDAWSCHPVRWTVYVRCFWRELVHTFRQDSLMLSDTTRFCGDAILHAIARCKELGIEVE